MPTNPKTAQHTPGAAPNMKLYDEANGGECPYCQSSDIEADGFETDSYSQEVSCRACGRRWLDCYQLTGLIEYDQEHGEFGKDHANAAGRAIDAQPDLLAALEAAAALVKVARGHFPLSMHNPDKFQLENTNAAITRAIARARGE